MMAFQIVTTTTAMVMADPIATMMRQTTRIDIKR
jgi:hypothetical protein